MQDISGEFIEKNHMRQIAQIMNGADQAVLFIEESGRIAFSNQSADRFLGIDGEKLQGKDINTFSISPPVMDLLHSSRERFELGGSVSGEFEITHPDGGKSWTVFRALMIKQGEIKLYCLISQQPDEHFKSELNDINRLLEKIDLLLGDGIDYSTKLSALTQILSSSIADWCGIHLLGDNGTLEQAALAPAEIMKNQAVYEWWQNDLVNDDADGLAAAFKKQAAILTPNVNPVRRAYMAGIKSYMVIPLKTSRQMIGAITLVSAESGRHFDRDDLSLAENLALHIASHLERSQIHQDSQKINAELEQRVHERTAELGEAVTQLKQSEEMIQTLFRVSNKLNATLDVELILDELAKEAISIVNGESGFAGLRTAEGMTVHRYYQQGVVIPFEHTWALGEGIPGWVMKYKVPYGTSDAENDPLIKRDLTINANIRSVICTPILDTVGEVIAYFDIRNKHGGEGFTINDQEMLLTLAPVASIAIQNALAYQQRLTTVAELKESSRQLQELAASQELNREEERMQIAQELHDQLGQELTALKFDIAWLADQFENKDDAIAQKTKDITAQVNSLIKNVRRIATELRPGMLDDLGLNASVEWQVRDFEKRTGIECSLSLPGQELTLRHDQALAIYRILQEALTNVARYAEAKHVEVQLAATGDLVTLEVRDDGRGIQEEEAAGLNSLGILGMRERAKHSGGSLEIHGTPGRGTTLMVTIPATYDE